MVALVSGYVVRNENNQTYIEFSVGHDWTLGSLGYKKNIDLKEHVNEQASFVLRK